MKAHWILGIAMAATAYAGECTVTVSAVDNFDSPSNLDVMRAENQVVAIFASIGVKLRWRDFQPAGPDDCTVPIALDLVSDADPRASRSALAYALPLLPPERASASS